MDLGDIRPRNRPLLLRHNYIKTGGTRRRGFSTRTPLLRTFSGRRPYRLPCWGNTRLGQDLGEVVYRSLDSIYQAVGGGVFADCGWTKPELLQRVAVEILGHWPLLLKWNV